MDKSKFIKIIIAVLLILVIIVIILLIKLNKVDLSQIPDPPQEIEEIEVKRELKDLSITTNEYNIVKNIIKDYYNYCNELKNGSYNPEIYRLPLTEQELQEYISEEINESKKSAQNAMYNILDKSYIEEFNITKENIFAKFGIQNQVEVAIEKIYVFQNSINVSTYITKGICIDTKQSKTEDFNLAVCLDLLNNTFSIYPPEYLEKHNYINISEGSKIELDIESIENKEYNTFEYKHIEDNEIAKEYFNNFKYTMLYNADKAYDILDKEYREKRFGNLDNFKKYVQEIYNNLSKGIVTKYQVEESNNTKQYICLDNFENYYIFNQINNANYSAILDTYTIDNQKFIKEYNSSDETKKVQMNIDKFIQMINAKDYKSAYELLYDDFKNNYFPTEDVFKQYIKNNLFEYNKITFDNFTNEGDTYIYELVVSDKLENSTKEKILTVIMKLKEGTDFVMSFSIE